MIKVPTMTDLTSLMTPDIPDFWETQPSRLAAARIQKEYFVEINVIFYVDSNGDLVQEQPPNSFNRDPDFEYRAKGFDITDLIKEEKDELRYFRNLYNTSQGNLIGFTGMSIYLADQNGKIIVPAAYSVLNHEGHYFAREIDQPIMPVADFGYSVSEAIQLEEKEKSFFEEFYKEGLAVQTELRAFNRNLLNKYFAFEKEFGKQNLSAAFMLHRGIFEKKQNDLYLADISE